MENGKEQGGIRQGWKSQKGTDHIGSFSLY